MSFALLAPELVLVGTAILVIVLDLVVERKKVLAGFSVAGLLAAIGLSLWLWGRGPDTSFSGMLVIDQFALFFKLIVGGAAILVVLSSIDYAANFRRFQGEYYALILFSAVGLMLMAATRELVSIYISLELASISLYVLAGMLKDQKSSEAGLKYLLLGAIASAVLIYGMAMIFGFTGTTHLSEIARGIGSLGDLWANPGLVLGIVLMIAGFGFKIASVPFQMWVPDVYEGAPTPVTAYLSVASKAAGFAVIVRVFLTAFGEPAWLSANWGMIFAILAAISMTVGNVLALPQNNIKRLLGYSSIAQAGYIMVGLAVLGYASGDAVGRSSILFFLFSYIFTNLGAFVAIIAISNKINSDTIDDYAGMAKRAPLLALALGICLISLIGIPPTAGFMAKVYIFWGGVQQDLLWLIIIGVVNSVISAFYYLRIVKAMYFGTPATEDKVSSSPALSTALVLCSLGVLVLGIAPSLVMRVAEGAGFLMP